MMRTATESPTAEDDFDQLAGAAGAGFAGAAGVAVGVAAGAAEGKAEIEFVQITGLLDRLHEKGQMVGSKVVPNETLGSFSPSDGIVI